VKASCGMTGGSPDADRHRAVWRIPDSSKRSNIPKNKENQPPSMMPPVTLPRHQLVFFVRVSYHLCRWVDCTGESSHAATLEDVPGKPGRIICGHRSITATARSMQSLHNVVFRRCCEDLPHAQRLIRLSRHRTATQAFLRERMHRVPRVRQMQ
jgi:hypothetical protein